MPDYVSILLNSLYSFVALFIIAKFLGKKQIAELSFTDYVVGITIGSVAAEWSTDVEKSWYFYVISLGVFFLLSFLITVFERTTLPLKTFLRGKPILIISEGKVDYKNLKKSKLDVNDLLGLCRDKGFFDIRDVAFAIFETNGNLSVLPKGPQTPTVVEDIRKKVEPASLTKFVINDGQIDENYLKQLGKNKEWLLGELNIKSKKDLKNIIVALYDEGKNKFDVHYKKE